MNAISTKNKNTSDRNDDPGRASLQCAGQGEDWVHHAQTAQDDQQEVVSQGDEGIDGEGIQSLTLITSK